MSLDKVILAASTSRPKLVESIGYGESVLGNEIPALLNSIYSIASGTYRNISDQTIMDIIPGYRLIHSQELNDEIREFRDLYHHLQNFIPFLADYSSGYVAVNEDDNSIFYVTPEYGESMVATSLNKFWETVLRCYEQQVYFLDADGYLDYDFEKEGEIGLSINPTCEYWNE